jgi:single-strand DNA-binding protein
MSTITLVGNLSADPELRFTASGLAVAGFTVCHTPRFFDKNTNEWRDGETIFMRCSIWREYAGNVAESLRRGDRVMVTGKIKSRSWETDAGEKRTVIELDAEEVGPALRYGTTRFTKATRSDAAPDADAWATSSASSPVTAVA